MQLIGWDHALKVTADAKGLVGHAGAILLRKGADQAGLTGALSAALRKAGTSPLLDRGAVLVSMAIAIALGATSMSDIALLAHLAPVLGTAPSGPTVRRALDLAGTPAVLDRIARARARARARAWTLIQATPAGFPWLEIAGKTLAGWVVIDMDATLVTAHSEKEGAAPTWTKGYGFHPLGAWCRNTRECLDMLLRPGNAGSNTFTDHQEVLTAAIRQVPARFRRQILVRVDGAGASHDLIKHLLSLTSPRRMLLFTCGWMITAADEDAIRLVPADAWKPGTAQDGTAEQDKDVAEITHLMSRAGNWPGGLRWIARRVKPSRRQMRNLTAWEKKTGWRYSITSTNIPGSGIDGVPGSHHPSTSTSSTASTPAWRPPGSAPPRPWACAPSRRRPGRSTPAGSSPRTSRPTWPPGPGSSATATTTRCGKPTPIRSATGCGTCLPASPATPGNGPSRSAPTGHGPARSSPAGSGSAPCPHPPDQHEPPARHGRRATPARSEPARTRAHRAARTATAQDQNRHDA